MSQDSKHHPHDPIARELRDLLDYEAAVEDALKVANWRPEPIERPTLTSAEVYGIIRGRLVAHLIVKTPDGHVTTRPYRNLGAAQRAEDRAHHRGCAATIVMVRQDVAPLVGGGVSHGGRHEVYLDEHGQYRSNLRAEGGAA
ncbi:hypothetical protein ET495_11255 [Xylanimonas allomyrinae]|uniref:Uncharacterized protein n=1 Tax=Xylanimonas allomyrinae TaxID=2509459 RepID=A0A4P6ETM5_9MICO|nr:hypothetical protein [Xylanimonas allomyrinae]QAY63727.1 hypothetical protein ET495_11255 [Xylanimonas allomyrinae]